MSNLFEMSVTERADVSIRCKKPNLIILFHLLYRAYWTWLFCMERIGKRDSTPTVRISSLVEQQNVRPRTILWQIVPDWVDFIWVHRLWSALYGSWNEIIGFGFLYLIEKDLLFSVTLISNRLLISNHEIFTVENFLAFWPQKVEIDLGRKNNSFLEIFASWSVLTHCMSSLLSYFRISIASPEPEFAR